MWKYTGQERPPFAEQPEPGQESVWDYPRPPAVVMDRRRVEVRDGARLVAAAEATWRVLETASPPAFYLPLAAVTPGALERLTGVSECEWKGTATYWALAADPGRGAVAWSYDDPPEAYRKIRGFLSCYPAKVACFVDGERVRPQPGRFYGGWLTDEIAGPVKGGPGSEGW